MPRRSRIGFRHFVVTDSDPPCCNHIRSLLLPRRLPTRHDEWYTANGSLPGMQSCPVTRWHTCLPVPLSLDGTSALDWRREDNNLTEALLGLTPLLNDSTLRVLYQNQYPTKARSLLVFNNIDLHNPSPKSPDRSQCNYCTKETILSGHSWMVTPLVLGRIV